MSDPKPTTVPRARNPYSAPNPYVGPRAFRANELLPARDRETRELANLVIAERIVLLHAPSGAGKTSLIQAGLTPLLAKERFRLTDPLRVKTPPPAGLTPHNRYVYSVALDLLGEERAPEELVGMNLPAVVHAAEERLTDGFLVIVLDQLEEVLLIDPTDRDNQRRFFRELGESLADGRVWALLSMREDYMGGLDRFARYLPGHLATRYRLDFLNSESGAAAAAIQHPAFDKGVEFTDEAAAELVRQLATAKVPTPGGGEKEVSAPFVQPVQLQVVCRELWRSVRREKREGFRSIELADVERHADIPGALRSYYAGVVEHVARTTGADEGAIRRWFQRELITPQGFRSQTLAALTSRDADPAEILRLLQDAYLIRSDTRADATWYELAHDKLVKPILADNDEWLRPHLEPWQLAAREWEENRDPARLMSGMQLRIAQRRSTQPDLTHKEREFIEASIRAEQERGVVPRVQSLIGIVGVIAGVELVVIVVLVALLLGR